MRVVLQERLLQLDNVHRQLETELKMLRRAHTCREDLLNTWELCTTPSYRVNSTNRFTLRFRALLGSGVWQTSFERGALG